MREQRIRFLQKRRDKHDADPAAGTGAAPLHAARADQALHRTQHLTEAQFRELMDIWKPHAKAPPG